MKSEPTPEKPKRSAKWLDAKIVENLRLEFSKGATAKELSEKFNIPFQTIRSRIEREQWPQKRAELKMLTAKTATQYANEVASQMASTAGDLIREVIADTRLAMTRIREFFNSSDLKPKDMPDLVNALKLCVGMQRQALGLSDESAQQGAKSVVNVQVVTHGTAGAKMATGGSDIPMSNPIDLPIGKA